MDKNINQGKNRLANLREYLPDKQKDHTGICVRDRKELQI